MKTQRKRRMVNHKKVPPLPPMTMQTQSAQKQPLGFLMSFSVEVSAPPTGNERSVHVADAITIL